MVWICPKQQRRDEEKTRRYLLLKKRFSSVCDIDSIPTSVHKDVLGDYLSNKKLRPDIGLRAVLNNVNLYSRFLQHKGAEHPRLFKTFCNTGDQFDAYYESVQSLYDKRDRAFTEEWMRISSFLFIWYVNKIRNVSPVFATARAARFATVKKAFDAANTKHGNYSEDYIFSKDQDLRIRIVNVFKKRFHFTENIGDEFSRILVRASERPTRRALLKRELQSHNMTLRGDSKFCQQFINGDVTNSVQEVVATMKISAFLFRTGGHRCFSENHELLKARMQGYISAGTHSCWYLACDAALGSELTSWEYDSSDEEDYY